MLTVNQVRADLKRISKKNNDIAIMQRTKQKYEERLAVLRSAKSDTTETEVTLAYITRNLQHTIEQAANLEKVYMSKILGLQPLYRSVLIDHYINGTVRWKTAEKANYSDSHVAHIITEALKALTNELNKAE